MICSNVLGGCRGTTGPASLNPATGCPYAMSFPVITIGDMVRLQKMLIDHLGIPAAAGGDGRIDGRDAGAGVGGIVSRRGGLGDSDRDHGAAQRAADRVQRSGTAGHHGGPGLERGQLLRQSRRPAAWRWRAWWATSPT